MSDNPNGYDFGKGLSSGIRDDIDWDQWLAEFDTAKCIGAIEVRTKSAKCYDSGCSKKTRRM